MRGGASAGETDGPDRGLPPLATGAEEDRRTLGRGEMLARLPALSAARAPAGPRRSLSDGVATESETARDTAPGSGLGGDPTATGVGRERGLGEQDECGATPRIDTQDHDLRNHPVNSTQQLLSNVRLSTAC